MGPIVLEGHTLGNRHQHYNKLIHDAKYQSLKLEKINYDDTDIENLFKIDIANQNRNVDFILDVLKCEDILYVSRAIKGCSWLIVDDQYADIINPEYLHSQLFPEMMSKAFSKLLLYIRLKLKDENRVEQFYNYFIQDNVPVALKWLQNCSLDVIEQAIVDHANVMQPSLIKRLCEKSIKVLDVFVRHSLNNRNAFLERSKFLMRTHLDKYLDIVESLQDYERPQFGAKGTKIIMKACQQRILNNFEKYVRYFDYKVFAKHLNKDQIIKVLLRWVKNENIRYLVTFEILTSFFKHMPKDNRFIFIKQVFIDKDHMNGNITEDISERALLCDAVQSEIHIWYQFAPFDEAFSDLKKLIRSESIQDTRMTMLAQLITCADGNLQYINGLLQYYQDKHINEPFNIKSQFVKRIILNTNTHRYDSNTWEILNTLFHSMEVYTETEKNVKSCVECIIVYKTLHNEEVPAIIKEKFEFNSLLSWKKKFSKEEQDKIFDFLYNLVKTMLKNISDVNNKNVNEAVELLTSALNLLKDWNKEILDYKWLLKMIVNVIQINKENELNLNVSNFYCVKKLWRKHMFQESILLSPSEEVLINVLKHNPDILMQHKKELEAMCFNDSISLRRFLNKLRIYWPQTLTNDFKFIYLHHLSLEPKRHKSLVCGLCSLLSKKELCDIIKKYVPEETKINWGKTDSAVISLRKEIAKQMYTARPLLSPDVILSYAKGDYLQYALLSLSSIFCNISSAQVRNNIPRLLDASVSLQKHGIRLSMTKLEIEDIIQKFDSIWKSSKNATIRTILFQQTFHLLRQQSSKIQELWQLLSMFIESLSSEENKIIHHLMAKVKDVPYIVRGEYCIKSYVYLKSLPAKANCEQILIRITDTMKDIMELLDASVVENILGEFIEQKFLKREIKYFELDTLHTLSTYLLCTKDQECGMQRYSKILEPLINRSLHLWGEFQDGEYYIRQNLNMLLEYICKDFNEYVVRKRMIIPVNMFTAVLNKLEQSLHIRENYKLLRKWKLATTYVTLLGNYKSVLDSIRLEDIDNLPPVYSDYTKWHDFYSAPASDFATLSLKYLKQDINLYFRNIYYLFSKAMNDFFDYFYVLEIIKLKLYKLMLSTVDSLEGHLLVLNLLPDYRNVKYKQETKELHERILLYPSEELKMQYYNKFDRPLEEESNN